MEIGGRALDCLALLLLDSVVGSSSTSAVSCVSLMPCMWRSLARRGGGGGEGGRKRDRQSMHACTASNVVEMMRKWLKVDVATTLLMAVLPNNSILSTLVTGLAPQGHQSTATRVGGSWNAYFDLLSSQCCLEERL